MKKLGVLSILVLFIFISCATVPITGRKSLSFIPASQLHAMSFSQYDEFLKTHKLSEDPNKTEMVKHVGKKIQKAVESYFAMNEMSQKLNGYQWEFNLVDSKEVNAWCMPGGKVVIYTGILPVAKGERGLAVVMGHEIAHAIAGHGNERMSQALIAQLGGMALSEALDDKPEKTQALWMMAYGMGAQIGVLLPFSRLHESEADHLGLIFMAMAGYDPNESVQFWERMSDMKEGQAPPEFISTHPSDKTRINKLKALIPEAMTYYRN